MSSNTTVDDGTNAWGVYTGFSDYFFPDTALVMTVSAMIVFLGFSTDVKKLCEKTLTTKDFPIINLGAYLITSSFMFMFVFGNGTTESSQSPRLLVDASTSLIESSTICLIGKMGYYMCMLWGCFYVYYSFGNLRTSVLATVGFIFVSFVVLFILALILKIPLINRIIITVMFTAFNLIPGIEIKKIWEEQSTKKFNLPALWGTFILNCAVTVNFIKSMDIFGFNFIGFIVIINFLIVLGFIGVYIYLSFAFAFNGGNQEENANNSNTSDKIEETNNNIVMSNFPTSDYEGPKPGEVTVDLNQAENAYEPPEPAPGPEQ